LCKHWCMCTWSLIGSIIWQTKYYNSLYSVLVARISRQDSKKNCQRVSMDIWVTITVMHMSITHPNRNSLVSLLQLNFSKCCMNIILIFKIMNPLCCNENSGVSLIVLPPSGPELRFKPGTHANPTKVWLLEGTGPIVQGSQGTIFFVNLFGLVRTLLNLKQIFTQ